MHHAITLGDLLSAISILCGLALAGGGVLAVFAGGMSDAPQEGDDVTKNGCIVLVAGAVAIALGIWGLS